MTTARVPAPRPPADPGGPGPGPAAIEVRGLTRRFHGRTVLDRVDLAVARRERVGVSGPNGSGKTTLLRCVAGTLAPSAGRVLVLGQPAGSRPARLALGVCLGQERAFYGRLSGRENLLFAARLRLGPAAAARAVAEICDELDLGPFAGQPVERCSSGMRARLALGRALAGYPEVVLLDEPARSLDAPGRRLVTAALGRRPGLTVLVASPRREDLAWCTRVVDLGCASADGPVSLDAAAGHRAGP